MATTKQKRAARKNIAKARTAQSARVRGRKAPRSRSGLSTAAQNKLPDSAFAFPEQRKEPLTDAKHVRNAVARFDQVHGVNDKDRDLAFANLAKAAKHYDVELSESSWHELGRTPH